MLKKRRGLRPRRWRIPIGMYVRNFWADRDGAVLPYVALMLVVVIGLSALAIDGARLMSVQTQLQNAADALALAGAAELDRRPDSIIRARAAIDNLIGNRVAGVGDSDVEVGNITFLRSLPSRDDLPITSANLTDDPTFAAYVEVAVKPLHVPGLFPISLSLGRRTVGIGADAVAGYDQVVCKATPLYVCNPFEESGMSYYQATQALVAADQDPAKRRVLIRLAGNQSSNGIYGPGSVGYIAPDTGFLPASGCGPAAGSGVPQALAASTVNACFRLSAVTLLPSNDRPAMDGLNTRFDIYANGFNACHMYLPDRDVRKGYTTFGNVNWCKATPASPSWPLSAPQATALPVDQNMIGSGGLFNPNIGVGNGTWNCATYWSIAHAVGTGSIAPPPGCTAAATISRYDVYKYELNYPSDRSLGAETGAPQCNPPGQPNRRVLTAAIINCGSVPVPMQGAAQGVPVAAFGHFFLVLPANSQASGNAYGEFIGLVKRSDPMSSDLVELYR